MLWVLYRTTVLCHIYFIYSFISQVGSNYNSEDLGQKGDYGYCISTVGSYFSLCDGLDKVSLVRYGTVITVQYRTVRHIKNERN